jgi:oxygen-dependent protoporphyrinogen oxidase
MEAGARRVVVIGGGISGLSCAYDLTRAGVDCTILEKRNRPGGVIETRLWENCLIDCGPDSFISLKPEALELIKDVGLEADVIGSHDHQRTTYILKKGKLVRLPDGVMMIVPTKVMPMLTSPLLGWGTKIRMAFESFREPAAVGDRSVADFVVDHFGQETLDYLAEPLLSGVYGGDPSRMSTASVLPRFLDMEARYGSLVRGALAARRKAPPSDGGPLFRTLRGGLGNLVGALAAKVTLRQEEAETLERREDGSFRVRAGGDWMDATHVVVACPAWAGSALLSGIDGDLAGLLGGIPYSSSLTLALIYRASEFNGTRAGFGFLVPKCERKRLAACTFVGTKFAHRAPEDRILLRCFFGGEGDEAVLGESDESLLAMARDELRRILGLTAAPIFHTISRWPRSMAQYTLGHAFRLREIENLVSQNPGLFLAGNAYQGIGIPDCIRMGRKAAARIIKGV